MTCGNRWRSDARDGASLELFYRKEMSEKVEITDRRGDHGEIRNQDTERQTDVYGKSCQKKRTRDTETLKGKETNKQTNKPS